MTAEGVMDNLLKEAEYYALGGLVQRLQNIQRRDTGSAKYILAVSTVHNLAFSPLKLRNLHQVWRIIENSKTFRPLDEATYNALVYELGISSETYIPGRRSSNATDSMKQTGYTITRAWWDTPANSPCPSYSALLVKDNPQ